MKRKKRSRSKAIIFMLIGAACLTACVALTLHNVAEDIAAGKAAMQTVSQIEVIIETQETEEPISEEDFTTEDESIYLEGYTYIGIVRIPSLDIKLPVLAAWSYPGLKISPCRYSGSAIKKNLIIAGHNYSSHFGPIRGLKGGETVYFTGTSGYQFKYTVTAVETILETDVDALYEGDWDLALFTCTADGESRVVVRCCLAEKE